MWKQVCLAFLTLLMGTANVWAQSSPWDRVAYWDGDRRTAWADEDVTVMIRDGLEAAGYTVLDAAGLKTWMTARIADKKLSVAVMCRDNFPDTVVEENSTACTVRQYLDAGGKIVCYSDIPFWHIAQAGGTYTAYNGAGCANILGLNDVRYTDNTSTEVTLTEDGIAWGLTETWVSARWVQEPENMTVLARDGEGHPAAWVLHYLPADTCRGFVRIWDMNVDIANYPSVEDIVAVAEYAGGLQIAYAPSPANTGTDVLRNTVLSWRPIESAVSHDVYFGPVHEDVEAATRGNPLGVLVSRGQTETTYDPEGPLEFGVTYYWRIDEVTSDGAIYAGDVWSFTVEPLARPIQSVVATSNTTSLATQGPERLVDGSGLNADGQHSINADDMWAGRPNPNEPSYLAFEFDRAYKLHEMHVWNYNIQFEPFLGYGLKNVTLEYSLDGVDWTVLGDAQFTQSSASNTYAGQPVSLEGVAAQYLRMVINRNFSGSSLMYGLSEVQFSYVPVVATQPTPADGAWDVTLDTALSWRTGREAAFHEIYVGASPDALAMVGTTTQVSYDATLDLDATHYWQVVEVNNAETVSSWASDIWTFTTQEYLVVDDFEAYNDDVDAGGAVWQTWVDGIDDSTNGGAVVGYGQSPFAEQTLIHGGKQSMPLVYDNASASAISEADRTFASPQDWSVSGIKSLSLWFYGASGNTGTLYVKINNTKVLYDGAATDISTPQWQPWNIDLTTVGGNLSNVTVLTIGVQGAGTGSVFIDDIRLYAKTPQYVTPAQPGTANLVAHYALDGNANDSSGHGYNGAETGGYFYVTGVNGQAFDSDGASGYINIANATNWPSGYGPRTMSAWLLTRSVDSGYRFAVAYGTAAGSGAMFLGINGTTLYGGGYSNDLSLAGFWTTDEWYHTALTYDGTTARLYANGREVVSGEKDWNLTLNRARIGQQINDYSEFWEGTIDEVRIYSTALSSEEIAYLAGRTTEVSVAF